LQSDVHFRSEHQTGIITLDRPHTLNALNLQMVEAMHHQLLKWMDDDQVDMVIIESKHERSFCAGGDLRSLYHALNAQEFKVVRQIFEHEYALNFLIRCYPKPFIAFIDGIVMGGGIGISIHGTYRVLGDNVVAAMPETNIGFFPDVGASIFLNDCPGYLGRLIGLTGIHLNTADTLYSRLGTHYVPSDQHQYLKEKLIECPNKDQSTLLSIINAFQRPTPAESQFKAVQAEIDQLFAGEHLEDIISNLSTNESELSHKMRSILSKRSPTSLKMTFELLRRGRSMNIADAMRQDFALSQKCLMLPDFREGIRAAIIDKDQSPQWQPSSLEQVSDDYIQSLFEAISDPLVLDEIDD
jgi:enoyl-CoA hydratase/carnithine racemase